MAYVMVIEPIIYANLFDGINAGTMAYPIANKTYLLPIDLVL